VAALCGLATVHAYRNVPEAAAPVLQRRKSEHFWAVTPEMRTLLHSRDFWAVSCRTDRKMLKISFKALANPRFLMPQGEG
jgi:hypothetical protein